MDIPTILIVDDEVDACANLADIFGELGFRADVAHDGSAALELVRKTPYDVALLDLKMPGMDGLTLYREIKQLRPGTVAVIVTGFAGNETASAALSEGAVAVLSKPVDFGNLLGVTNRVLDQPLALVIDDDEALCRNLWELMHERGLRVCLAHNQEAAHERLSGRKYDLVLIDMKLPDGDGRSVFQLVRETNPQARAIVITGFRSETEPLLQQLVEQGIAAVCYKPFDVEQLLSTVDRLANRRDEQERMP